MDIHIDTINWYDRGDDDNGESSRTPVVKMETANFNVEIEETLQLVETLVTWVQKTTSHLSSMAVYFPQLEPAIFQGCP